MVGWVSAAVPPVCCKFKISNCCCFADLPTRSFCSGGEFRRSRCALKVFSFFAQVSRGVFFTLRHDFLSTCLHASIRKLEIRADEKPRCKKACATKESISQSARNANKSSRWREFQHASRRFSTVLKLSGLRSWGAAVEANRYDFVLSLRDAAEHVPKCKCGRGSLFHDTRVGEAAAAVAVVADRRRY